MPTYQMIPFTKMHGLGNDFVVINATSYNFPHQALTASWFKQISDRHLGVGCDQILLLMPAKTAEQDFCYEVYNSDGSTSEQCGNGARCLGLFINRQALSSKETLKIGMKHGDIIIENIRAVSKSEGIYRVNMLAPIFTREKIPFIGAASDKFGLCTISMPAELVKEPISVSVLSLGNPHVVITVADIGTAPINTWGPILSNHKDFPNRVNVGFMAIKTINEIDLRVYERGVGETLACGSGAAAAAVAGIRQKKLQKDAPILVHLPGGDITISWAGDNEKPVLMEGLATTVFESAFPINLPA